MNELTWTFFLSAGEVNAEAELSLPLLTSKIIDIATAHANELGIGNPTMAARNAGWVLSRLTIEMNAYPKVNDTYSLTTWVESWTRHFSIRCFCISDAEGNPLGYARSVWMVMNTVTHVNEGLSHLSFDPALISDRECPIERQAKHLHIDPSDTDRHYTFKYCDIDYYRHVNTVRYVTILLNAFTLEEMDASRVHRFELSFLHEGRYGSTVDIRRRDLAASKENEQSNPNEQSNHINPSEPIEDRSEFLLVDSELKREVLYARINRRPK